MLLAEYGSDSGSDNEDGPSTKPQIVTKSVPSAKAAVASSAPIKGKKRAGGPVRITLDLPKSSKKDDTDDGNELDGDEDGSDDRDGDGDDNGRENKKAKFGSGIKGGKGSSALLGMLPPPKRKLPIASGSASGSSGLAVNKSMAAKAKTVVPPPPGMEGMEGLSGLGASHASAARDDDDDEEEANGGGLPMPASMARAKAKAKKNEPIDLFGLAAPSSSSSSSKISPAPSLPKPTEITSAPAVTDFAPPPPTVADPYPGYYQTPSGAWAAYDPEYYHSFFPDSSTSQAEEPGNDGRLGKEWDTFRGREGDVIDVYAGEGLEEARKEQERQSKMIKPRTLGDGFEYKTIGQTKGLASDRHQLSSLLHSAYSQREALEDSLAQNKKNMRLARTKYGF